MCSDFRFFIFFRFTRGKRTLSVPSFPAPKQPPQQTTCFARFYAASGPAICAQTLDFLDLLVFLREMHICMAKPFCGIRACPLCSDFLFFRFFRFPMGKAHFHGQVFQPPHNRHNEPRILLKFLRIGMVLVAALGGRFPASVLRLSLL